MMIRTSTSGPAVGSLFIGGRRVASSGDDRLVVTDPYTGEVVGSAPRGTVADVDRAVTAARRAFVEGEWAAASPGRRAEHLRALADAWERRGDELAALVTAEMGQHAALSRGNAVGPPRVLRYYADLADRLVDEEMRPKLLSDSATIVRREPVGVAGMIIPWNYPLSLLVSKLAPALAAGCTAVVKPAEETPLSALLVGELCAEAGLPAGVVNVVTGGRETGAALVAHRGVDKIAFTGSTEAGRVIARECADRLRPVSLELGGKSAAVVLPDADPAQVVPHLRMRSFANAGQTCFLLARVLVPRARLEEYVVALTDAAESIRVGDPRDPDTEMGPLVSERIRIRVAALVDDARSSGADIRTGGAYADGPGYGYLPTVITGVEPSSRIAQEEVFGPVVVVLGYDDEDDALRIANDSRYGLGGAVFSADEERAIAFARRMETGTVGINSYTPDVSAPFGGYKDSGMGRENGPEALEQYRTYKSIYLP